MPAPLQPPTVLMVSKWWLVIGTFLCFRAFTMAPKWLHQLKPASNLLFFSTTYSITNLKSIHIPSAFPKEKCRHYQNPFHHQQRRIDHGPIPVSLSTQHKNSCKTQFLHFHFLSSSFIFHFVPLFLLCFPFISHMLLLYCLSNNLAATATSLSSYSPVPSSARLHILQATASKHTLWNTSTLYVKLYDPLEQFSSQKPILVLGLICLLQNVRWLL